MKISINLLLQKCIKRYLVGQSQRIVVASTGRAGSTLLVEAISDAYVKKNFTSYPQELQSYLSKCASEFLVNISDVTEATAPIIKTHDTYNPEMLKNCKCVFIYGDPLESALSCKRVEEHLGQEFTEMHIKHLKGFGSPNDILERDVLNYEGQLRSWQFAKNTLQIDYRTLWERQDALSDFLDMPVPLPAKKNRHVYDQTVTHNAELFGYLRELYKTFPNLD